MYKNIFISQPMTGKSEEEILATRQKEIDKIHQLFDADGVEINIIASYIDDATRKHFKEHVSDDINWDIFWLSQSLERLAMADMIWLCEGWEYSKGCNVELECAMQYGISIVYPEYITEWSEHK
jgi:hypothetical protein